VELEGTPKNIRFVNRLRKLVGLLDGEHSEGQQRKGETEEGREGVE